MTAGSFLIIVTETWQQLRIEGTGRLVGGLIAEQSVIRLEETIILHPSALVLDGVSAARLVPYGTGLGLEMSQAIWRPLLECAFAEIIIFGIDERFDFEEMILACYLPGARKTYFGRHGGRDLADWQAHVRPSFRPREVQVHRLDDQTGGDYQKAIHKWLAQELAAADFAAPTARAARSPDVSIYQYSRLAADLSELILDLKRDRYGGSFAYFRLLDGTFVASSDVYRSIANLVMAVDGIETVLDVGCGSGFLACHLASSGRYARVLGVDSSRYRVDAARLHAELNQCPAEFDVMSMTEIRLPDRSVDLCVTSFALEQSGPHLERCFAEIRRVARKLIVLVEPSNEFFPTLPSLWHVPVSGWANRYHDMLIGSGLSYGVRPNLLCNYYNPGAVFVIDVERQQHPRFSYPELFAPGLDGWPGGVRFV